MAARSRRHALLALALALVAPAAARAQWGGGYGFGAGYGFGGWGGGWGYGPFGGMGMTLYEQEAYKYQIGMLNNARYDMFNAMSAQNYAQANLMQQQAIQTALQNQQLADQISQDRYNLYNRTKNASAAKTMESVAPVPLSALIDDRGLVRWPDVAPEAGVHGPRRAETDRLVASAYHEFQAAGRATVSTANAAIRQLHAYGEPALTLLASRGDTRGRAEMVAFLNNVESALRRMAAPPEADQTGGAAPAAGANVPAPPAPGR